MALLRSRISLLLSLYLAVHPQMQIMQRTPNGKGQTRRNGPSPWKVIEMWHSIRRVCMTKQLQEGENPTVNSAQTAALAHDVD